MTVYEILKFNREHQVRTFGCFFNCKRRKIEVPSNWV